MNKFDCVYSGKTGLLHLNAIITRYFDAGIFILVDENTSKYCLPVLFDICPDLAKASIITIKSSEANKNISSVVTVWNQLMDGNAVRNSLLICLGGGVITDIGGFAAATFKRGIKFIHIPTTLLAMVDAAIGGKTGVNLSLVKNQVGVFAMPEAVYLFDQFLETLPKRQKLSGYAEVIKHALINSESHFEKLIQGNSPDKVCNEKSILESVSVKTYIVKLDPEENGVRKILNFGHTIGHAFETFSQKNDPSPLLHGEAIAIGMICESFISMRLLGFSENDLKKMSSLVNWHFPHYRLSHNAANELFSIMYHDKKNMERMQLNFTLLRNIGDPLWDQKVTEKLIRESLHFYTNLEIGFFV